MLSIYELRTSNQGRSSTWSHNQHVPRGALVGDRVSSGENVAHDGCTLGLGQMPAQLDQDACTGNGVGEFLDAPVAIPDLVAAVGRLIRRLICAWATDRRRKR